MPIRAAVIPKEGIPALDEWVVVHQSSSLGTCPSRIPPPPVTSTEKAGQTSRPGIENIKQLDGGTEQPPTKVEWV